MKKLFYLFMVLILFVSFNACGFGDDIETESVNVPTHTTKTAEKETQISTEIPTEKETKVVTQNPTEKENEQPPTEELTQPKMEMTSKELVLSDVTGMWEHVEYGEYYTINITSQDGNLLHMKITAVSKIGLHIAESDVDVTVVLDAAGGEGLDDLETLANLGGKGSFTYEDSFGNTGTGEILVSKDTITLSIYQTKPGANWGIFGASGNYKRAQ